MKFWYATPNFFKLYGIKIIEGSIPSFEGEGNRGEVLVANRAAMKLCTTTICLKLWYRKRTSVG